MKHTTIGVLLVLGVAGMASASTFAASATPFVGSDSVSWSTFDGPACSYGAACEENNYAYSNDYNETGPYSGTGYGVGINTVNSYQVNPYTQSNLDQTNGGNWFGDFNPSDTLLYYNGASTGPLGLDFYPEELAYDVYDVGFQIQPAVSNYPENSDSFYTPYTVQIAAYTGYGAILLGVACFAEDGGSAGCTPVNSSTISVSGDSGLGGNGFTADGSAQFVSVSDTISDITNIDITVYSGGVPVDFAIDSLETNPPAGPAGSVPEPTTLLLFGSGLLAAARGLRRRGRFFVCGDGC